MIRSPLWVAVAMATGLTLSGCSNDDNRDSTTLPPEPAPEVQVFAENGLLDVRIRRTTFGVPHIEADSIESLAFGSGYAQAQDHLCLLADGIIKANSERAKYFGPHKSIDFATGLAKEEDNQNLISDFGYKALGVRQSAAELIGTLPDRSRAMLSGFAAGYNLYLADLASGAVTTPNLPCAGQPWVKPMADVDMLTYLFSIALLPGAANFMDLIFFANPGDGDEYLPRPAATASVPRQGQMMLAEIRAKAQARAATLATPEVNPREMGSNGWGLGSEVTDNGRGIVLGNPHFPHTGQLRFWQSHLTIPGHLNVMGGSLVGMPGAVNIGFNQNLAWTHTFSTAEHFIMYNLSLKEGDRLTYLFEGEERAITPKTLTVEVNIGGGVTIPLEKEVYLTAKGPMVEAPPALAPFPWDDTQAFFIQDANMNNVDVLEHWSAMNFASNLEEFQQAFKSFDGVIFNNTMYADDQGNAFYIDDSTVPNIGSEAENALRLSPELRAARDQAGFTILPGDEARFAFDGAVPYERAPKLVRRDFVQNSNNSYWITNPAEPIEHVSPLYGKRRVQQSLRTRMGLTLMSDARGDDDKFSPAEVESALLSNRAYLAELVLPQLLLQCQAQGTTPVVVSDSLSVNITPACAALAKWNGAQNQDSVAGALLREFGYRFDSDVHLDVPFVYTDPINTPNTLASDGAALVALAAASVTLTQNGFDLEAPLGQMQFVEKSLPNGQPSGVRFPWSGANNFEGGFNVFAYTNRPGDDTLLPQHAYEPAIDAVTGQPTRSELTTEGYHIDYGSSWMMVVGFGDQGPEGRGLLTYSEAYNAHSPHWADQTSYYSDNTALRPLLFTEEAIAAETLSDIRLQYQK
ncbi:acylase [Ferrimonas sediminicola]|uniref:Acylase n=1 Tax=Ferrimonas sediminicola TaxID=2569538 RepID=A0A4U1BKZ7_9GAMM|nr:acylase [Ferrimonas sediminicola]TKB51327.1 acylase [Ferrimonas sediminicola]